MRDVVARMRDVVARMRQIVVSTCEKMFLLYGFA